MEPDLIKYLLRSQKRIEDLLASKDETEKLVEGLRENIANEEHYTITDVELISHSEEEIVIRTSRFGHYLDNVLNRKKIDASDWKQVWQLWENLTETLELPIVINQDKTQDKFYDYGSFYEHFMELGRKGAYIQRYKGLGEMNPEQLWETTLNPQNRNLLQVTIDDAMAADEIFSVLMGESVEPRKNFISDNALSVKELDV